MLNGKKRTMINLNKEALNALATAIAKKESVSFIEACSALQTAATKKGANEIIPILH